VLSHAHDVTEVG